MANRSPAQRARDILQHIQTLRTSFRGLAFQQVFNDPLNRAAFERFLEIISEASRFIPDDWRLQYGPNIEWRQIADLGNRLRHVYHRLDARLLWSIYEHDLDPLEAAVNAMLAAHEIDDKN